MTLLFCCWALPIFTDAKLPMSRAKGEHQCQSSNVKSGAAMTQLLRSLQTAAGWANSFLKAGIICVCIWSGLRLPVCKELFLTALTVICINLIQQWHKIFFSLQMHARVCKCRNVKCLRCITESYLLCNRSGWHATTWNNWVLVLNSAASKATFKYNKSTGSGGWMFANCS